MKDFFGFPTIRFCSCQILIQPWMSRCSECSGYRKVLNSMLSRAKNSTSSNASNPESHTNYRYLRTPQKEARLKRRSSQAKMHQLHIKRLKDRLKSAIEQRGIEVDDSLHEDLRMTMEESSSDVASKYPPDSFQHIFWKQQQQSAAVKNSKRMRWEPVMIRLVSTLPILYI